MHAATPHAEAGARGGVAGPSTRTAAAPAAGRGAARGPLGAHPSRVHHALCGTRRRRPRCSAALRVAAAAAQVEDVREVRACASRAHCCAAVVLPQHARARTAGAAHVWPWR
jgi:hypothetical protein